MMRIPKPYWTELSKRYPREVGAHYRARLLGSESFFERAPNEAAGCALLEELVSGGYLAAEDRKVCPACDNAIEAATAERSR